MVEYMTGREIRNRFQTRGDSPRIRESLKECVRELRTRLGELDFYVSGPRLKVVHPFPARIAAIIEKWIAEGKMIPGEVRQLDYCVIYKPKRL